MEVSWLAAFCLLNVAVPRIRADHNVPKTLSNPELDPGSPNVMVGSTVIIHCLSSNASLPVTFTLFQNMSAIGRMTVSEKREATFNVTIYNHTSLGPYKCKANNSASDGMYSKNFTFILQEHKSHGSGPTETLSNPELVSGSPNVTVGSTVTIHCRCKNATLPITFTLFQNKSTKGRMTVLEKREATFNVTIYNHTSLGPYKCKANNSASDGMYSKNFVFILQEHKSHGSGPTGETGGGWVHLAWIIPLLVLVILTAAFVFWRISTPDAKQEAIQEDATYETVSERGTERRKEEEEIHYSTVILKEGSREVTCAEQTAEYSIVTRTGQGFNSSHNSQ